MVKPGMQVRIFGRERWDLTELRQHFGVVAAGLLGELPGERTAVTPAWMRSSPASFPPRRFGPICTSPGRCASGPPRR